MARSPACSTNGVASVRLPPDDAIFRPSNAMGKLDVLRSSIHWPAYADHVSGLTIASDQMMSPGCSSSTDST